MAMIITVIVLVGGLAIMALVLIAFAYPELLVRASKFLFVKPFKALARTGHHKVAPLTVNTGEVKTDIPAPK